MLLHIIVYESLAQDSPVALASKFDAVAEVVTPPASKAKPSPPTGDKVTKTSKPPSQDPLQLQLQAMQKQLEEQGAQIAAYEKQRAERKSVPKPPSALELQLDTTREAGGPTAAVQSNSGSGSSHAKPSHKANPLEVRAQAIKEQPSLYKASSPG